MSLKWKLRLYYEALVLVLLALLGTATAAVVLRGFQIEMRRREDEVTRAAERTLAERLAAIDSTVARVARDPDLLYLARLDLVSSRDQTVGLWNRLAGPLSQRYGLPLLKILDAEGRVLSSAHWPAAYGFVDGPGMVLALEAPRGARLVRERTPSGDFLGLEAPCWLPEPRRYVVVGGVRADSLLERDLARAGAPLCFELQEEAATPGTAGAGRAGDPGTRDATLAVAGRAVARPGEGTAWVLLPTSPAELAGGFRLQFDRTALQDLKRNLAQIFGLAALVGTLLAWGLGLWISSRVSRPLEALADGVAALADGRTPHPIRVQGSTEVRDLVTGFNSMAESLADSRDRLRHAERIAAWRDVARAVAHEIKNALVPIQISAENVARSVHTGRGDLRALADESAATVRSEVEGLTRLVNAFSELSRLPDPEPRPARLQDTWERAAAPFRDQLDIEATGLETLPTLLYDDDQVRRALHNLLLNAQEAGARRLRLEVTALPGGFRLVLRDDGPGIAPADLERIFEPYFTRKNGGTGLGLTFVYKVCSDHGWRLGATSPADASAPEGRRGTAMTLVIPARAAVIPVRAAVGEVGPHAG